MKKQGILNRDLNAAIGMMGHGDIMILSDAALPVPNHDCVLVDLAIVQDYPDLITIFELIEDAFIFEKCLVAEEQSQFNPNHHRQICEIADPVKVELIPHADIISEFIPKAKVMVRTGSFMPWGNIILVSGIDTDRWFQKIGGKIPDRYFELNHLDNRAQ